MLTGEWAAAQMPGTGLNRFPTAFALRTSNSRRNHVTVKLPTPNVVQTMWMPLATRVLTNSSQLYLDLTGPIQGQRIYQATRLP